MYVFEHIKSKTFICLGDTLVYGLVYNSGIGFSTLCHSQILDTQMQTTNDFSNRAPIANCNCQSNSIGI
jgi:hypothetical protein